MKWKKITFEYELTVRWKVKLGKKTDTTPAYQVMHGHEETDLCIHRSHGKEGWSISHLPTKLAFGLMFKTRDDAYRASLMFWLLLTHHGPVGAKRAKIVRDKKGILDTCTLLWKAMYATQTTNGPSGNGGYVNMEVQHA